MEKRPQIYTNNTSDFKWETTTNMPKGSDDKSKCPAKGDESKGKVASWKPIFRGSSEVQRLSRSEDMGKI